MKNNDSFEKLQRLYEQGYRCIRYDDVKDEKMNVYLKNFDNEKSHSMEITTYTDKAQIIDYINKYNLFK